MNVTKVLQKCIDALNAEKPDISYIKGMLETVIEMTPSVLSATGLYGAITSTAVIAQSHEPIETELDANTRDYLTGPIGNIR